MVRIDRTTFRSALKQMRDCGTEKQECVVFIAEDAHRSLMVVHPEHRSAPGGYQVDTTWLGRFAARQAIEGIVVRAQMHTHPEEAFHSRTDDKWPMVGSQGFISIVVPRFGADPIHFDQFYACRLLESGDWERLEPSLVLER